MYKAELAQYLLFSDLRRHVLEGDVSRDYGELEPVADHEHGHVPGSESFLDIFRVPGEAEALVHHGLLVDGAGHKYVNLPFLELCDGPVQCGDGRPGRFRSGLSGLGETVVGKAVDYVHALGLGLGGAVDRVCLHLLDFGNGLAVETEKLGRTVDDRGELVEYPGV